MFASYTSPDGKYESLFQHVGDADWSFGHTHASPDLCHVTWKDDHVEAVISGEEQEVNGDGSR